MRKKIRGKLIRRLAESGMVQTAIAMLYHIHLLCHYLLHLSYYFGFD